MTDTINGQAFLPKYMLTCYFCMRTFSTTPDLNTHWEACEARQKFLEGANRGHYHVGLRGVRNLVGEVVFASEWKRLMETPLEDPEDDDDEQIDTIIQFIHRRPVRLRHVRLAASFITWLGTNCGGSFLHEAKRLVESNPSRRKADMFLAQWAIENRRSRGINHGGRMVEHFLYEGEQTATGLTRAFPETKVSDFETVEQVAYWLGTDTGQQFLTRCERIIYARQKGLSDYDMEQLGIVAA